MHELKENIDFCHVGKKTCCNAITDREDAHDYKSGLFFFYTLNELHHIVFSQIHMQGKQTVNRKMLS